MGSFHRFVVGVGGAAFYNFTAGGSADFTSHRSLEHLAAPRPAREACSSAASCHRAFLVTIEIAFVPVWPTASRAVTVSVCVPSATTVVSNGSEIGP